MKLEAMAESLALFVAEGVTGHRLSAEHDAIYVVVPDLRKDFDALAKLHRLGYDAPDGEIERVILDEARLGLSRDARARLLKLGWRWDLEVDAWCAYV